MRLSHGPKENRHRPAIDPLFRTAAEAHKSRVIGVVLTGTLDDGTMGLKAVKDAGGVTIVQEPREALYPDMPRNALQVVGPDFVLPLKEIGALLPRLIQEAAKEKVMKGFKDKGMKPENKRIKSGNKISSDLGPPSMFVCPECNGPLWEMRDGKATLFRCMVGHSFAPENLFAAQTEEVERALWIALRALEERIGLQHKLANRADSEKRDLSSKHFLNRARENSKHAAPPPAGWKEDKAPFAEVIRQLQAYFRGELKEFDLPLALAGTEFQLRVWDTLREIPYGETISYLQLAERIGNPKAVRAVGLANGSNPIPIIVPCHRVIGSDGSLTGFGGGISTKKKLLELESKQLSLL